MVVVFGSFKTLLVIDYFPDWPFQKIQKKWVLSRNAQCWLCFEFFFYLSVHPLEPEVLPVAVSGEQCFCEILNC